MSNAYANLITQALTGGVNLTGHTLKMGLLTSGYTPALTTHVHWADVSSHETSGTAYTAGGLALASVALTGPTAANSWSNAWAAGNNYLQGDIVRPTAGNGYVYMSTSGGTSGGSAPTWSPVIGTDVSDGGLTWVNIGAWLTKFTSANATWSAATFNAAYGVIYDTSTNVLICLLDFGGTQSPAAQNFVVEPDPVCGWVVFPPL